MLDKDPTVGSYCISYSLGTNLTLKQSKVFWINSHHIWLLGTCGYKNSSARHSKTKSFSVVMNTQTHNLKNYLHWTKDNRSVLQAHTPGSDWLVGHIMVIRYKLCTDHFQVSHRKQAMGVTMFWLSNLGINKTFLIQLNLSISVQIYFWSMVREVMWQYWSYDTNTLLRFILRNDKNCGTTQ